jgi:hypothetical protein
LIYTGKAIRMIRRLRRALLVLSVVAVLAGATAAVSATPAHAYGKANWQVALTGTFTFPTTGFGFGFWGWCDFAGGVTSGSDADCEIAEYMHTPPGTTYPVPFTCELSVDATFWDQSASDFGGNTFHVWGSAVVQPASLTASQKDACVNFFTNQGGSTTFADVDTFIPAAPGHYDFGVSFIPGAVGEFNFTVKQVG